MKVLLGCPFFCNKKTGKVVETHKQCNFNFHEKGGKQKECKQCVISTSMKQGEKSTNTSNNVLLFPDIILIRDNVFSRRGSFRLYINYQIFSTFSIYDFLFSQYSVKIIITFSFSPICNLLFSVSEDAGLPSQINFSTQPKL